jgi:hypothetical protein
MYKIGTLSVPPCRALSNELGLKENGQRGQKIGVVCWGRCYGLNYMFDGLNYMFYGLNARLEILL